MLKLHPHQVISHTVHTLSPSHSDSAHNSTDGGDTGDLCPPSWVRVEDGGRGRVTLPNLDSSACEELTELRDAAKNEGLLAYYVAMTTTDLGTE